MAASVPLSFEFYPPKTDEQRAQHAPPPAQQRAHPPE